MGVPAAVVFADFLSKLSDFLIIGPAGPNFYYDS